MCSEMYYIIDWGCHIIGLITTRGGEENFEIIKTFIQLKKILPDDSSVC